jgi:hypothetical protein
MGSPPAAYSALKNTDETLQSYLDISILNDYAVENDQMFHVPYMFVKMICSY